MTTQETRAVWFVIASAAVAHGSSLISHEKIGFTSSTVSLTGRRISLRMDSGIIQLISPKPTVTQYYRQGGFCCLPCEVKSTVYEKRAYTTNNSHRLQRILFASHTNPLWTPPPPSALQRVAAGLSIALCKVVEYQWILQWCPYNRTLYDESSAGIVGSKNKGRLELPVIILWHRHMWHLWFLIVIKK